MFFARILLVVFRKILIFFNDSRGLFIFFFNFFFCFSSRPTLIIIIILTYENTYIYILCNLLIKKVFSAKLFIAVIPGSRLTVWTPVLDGFFFYSFFFSDFHSSNVSLFQRTNVKCY